MNGIVGRIAAFGVVGGVFLGGGCDRDSPSPTPQPPARATAPPAAASDDERAELRADLGARSTAPRPALQEGSVLPPNHPPINRPDGLAPSEPRRSGSEPSGGLTLTVPPEWQATPVRSAMRREQFALPRAEGDEEDGELVVFDSRSLGGGGGTDDNLARWRSMMTTRAGTPVSAEAAKREDLEQNGMKIALLDVAGRYTPAQMPGVPVGGPKDDYRMLAAVIEAGDERVFIRATGPAATMAKHAAAFREYVLSVRR